MNKFINNGRVVVIKLMLIAMTLVVSACESEPQEEVKIEGHIKAYGDYSIFEKMRVQEIIDSETGVHYLIVFDKWTSSGGGTGNVTPLYNSDGTLKVN